MKSAIILLVLDGWGVGNSDESNPIYAAKPSAFEFIENSYPGGALQSSGMVVGLPWQKEGTSAFGHLMLGSGRIIPDYAKKIALGGENTAETKRPEPFEKTLGEVIANENRFAMRIAETAREREITYFFSGLRENPFPNEYRALIPSEQVARQEESPDMRITAVTDRLLISIKEGTFDFILANFANADMVARTGNFLATMKAIRAIDRELGRILNVAIDGGHTLVVTSSHGNAEYVLNLKTGVSETGNNPNPVPFYVVGRQFALTSRASNQTRKTIGILTDVAPTILSLLKINQPAEMTGENLLPQIGLI